MTSQPDLRFLPDNLPRPEDDGGADHLSGMALPDLALPSTAGGRVSLRALPRRTVLYAYPMTGVPGVPLPDGWNAIPGARGCSVQSLTFKDHEAEIHELGADVYGLSTQHTAYQSEMAERLHLPFAILSDADHALLRAMRLPTLTVDGKVLLKRLTMIVRDGQVETVFYPVFPVTEAAEEVLTWLRQPRSSGLSRGEP